MRQSTLGSRREDDFEHEYGCGFRKPQTCAYRRCSPPRIGCAIISPNGSIGCVQGASWCAWPSDLRPLQDAVTMFGVTIPRLPPRH